MEDDKEQQLFFMRAAIREGERGRGSSSPNPWVGCVLVNQGVIVGRGFHEKAGLPHAEVIAIQSAGERAFGSTAYVTLEPCAHHGRTPPCTEALIGAGVKRVVIPFLDPDRSSLSGADYLRKAGIDVVVGVGKEEAERSLFPYLYHRKSGMPCCILKTATSIDGCIAAQDGSSKWITSQMARNDARLLRAQCQAIFVGVETALRDQPSLTAENRPLRVVWDRRGRLPESGPLFDPKFGPTLIFTDSDRTWKNAQSVRVSSLKEILLELGRRGVMQLFVEGGAQMHAEFVRQGFVHKWVVYIGNCFLGSGKRTPFEVPSIADAPRLSLESVTRLGDDVKLTYNYL